MITTKVVVVQQLYTVLLPFKNTCSAAHKCSRRVREKGVPCTFVPSKCAEKEAACPRIMKALTKASCMKHRHEAFKKRADLSRQVLVPLLKDRC